MWWMLFALVLVITLFLVWADRKTRGRSSGPEANGDLQRRIGGFGGGNG